MRVTPVLTVLIWRIHIHRFCSGVCLVPYLLIRSLTVISLDFPCVPSNIKLLRISCMICLLCNTLSSPLSSYGLLDQIENTNASYKSCQKTGHPPTQSLFNTQPLCCTIFPLNLGHGLSQHPSRYKSDKLQERVFSLLAVSLPWLSETTESLALAPKLLPL